MTDDLQPGPLKAVLFREYDGFADKRLRDLSRDAPFIVDDRTEGDRGADKKLYGWFCEMYLDVVSGSQVRLTFRGELPTNPAVEQVLKELGAEANRYGRSILISRSEEGKLERLAAALESIIASRYPVKAYKYVVPRTAMSLRRLRATLSSVWGT